MERTRIIVFGANGMLGHKVYQEFNQRFDTWGTIRDSIESWQHLPFFKKDRIVENIEVSSRESIINALDRVQPEVVVNCIGIVKQLKEGDSPVSAITVNALLPHWLADLCQERGIRLIHISTDCVFSGKGGNYSENDLPDPYDLYGRTKLLGEVTEKNCLTLRTSIIGRELKRTVGLLEWFLSQNGKTVQGYRYAIFSGFITSELAIVLADIVVNHPELHGLYHLSSEPINKYDLLCMIKETLNLQITINEYTGFFVDRSLDSKRIREILKYQPPPWQEMIRRLATEVDEYEEWRR
jgi:dTDP-4-dehydrorhamnose reductase